MSGRDQELVIQSIVTLIPCILENCTCFLSSAGFFQSLLFQKNSFSNGISVSNSLGPDPDLGQECLQRLSADNTRRQKC